MFYTKASKRILLKLGGRWVDLIKEANPGITLSEGIMWILILKNNICSADVYKQLKVGAVCTWCMYLVSIHVYAIW